jgi:hypothetical protein
VVVDLKIIIFDPFQPSPLAEVEVRLSENVLQALVIGEDVTFVPNQVVSPYF